MKVITVLLTAKRQPEEDNGIPQEDDSMDDEGNKSIMSYLADYQHMRMILKRMCLTRSLSYQFSSPFFCDFLAQLH